MIIGQTQLDSSIIILLKGTDDSFEVARTDKNPYQLSFYVSGLSVVNRRVHWIVIDIAKSMVFIRLMTSHSQ